MSLQGKGVLVNTADPLVWDDCDGSQVRKSELSNNRALHGRSSVNSYGIKWTPTSLLSRCALPRNWPGRRRASWQPREALAGEGRIILPCLHAWDYFSAGVTWLWMLELAFSGKLKSGFNLASYINTSRTLTLSHSEPSNMAGLWLYLMCKPQIAEEMVFLRGWKAGF